MQPHLGFLMSFLDKNSAIAEAVFEQFGLLPDLEEFLHATDGFFEAVTGNGFDEKVQCSGVERFDGVVGVCGDEDACRDIHKT